jgi:hypothetical protein
LNDWFLPKAVALLMEMVPVRDPTLALSRKRVCELPAADSTTWCHLPSATEAEETIGLTPPLYQNSAFSLPSVPT